MVKIKLITFLVVITLLLPTTTSALQISDFLVPGMDLGFSAKAYLVAERNTGRVLLSKNSSVNWVPASLTKLVAAMTVLDTNPKLSTQVKITTTDQTAGGCRAGGACLATKVGVAYSIDGLFHASLIASVNNAANALARSTGLTKEQFAEKMNEKAKSLGAINSKFYEPTGMDAANVTTAEDYAKIVAAAFANPYLQKIAIIPEYTLKSSNNSRYVHKLKNTNKLVGDDRLQQIAGKTGYLDESGYNFASQVKDRFGNNFVVVLFGSKSLASEFDETRQLLDLAGLSLAFGGSVLGSSTQNYINFDY
jgi:D-alanyl-D-alanine carboxypeptidase